MSASAKKDLENHNRIPQIRDSVENLCSENSFINSESSEVGGYQPKRSNMFTRAFKNQYPNNSYNNSQRSLKKHQSNGAIIAESNNGLSGIKKTKTVMSKQNSKKNILIVGGPTSGQIKTSNTTNSSSQGSSGIFPKNSNTSSMMSSNGQMLKNLSQKDSDYNFSSNKGNKYVIKNSDLMTDEEIDREISSQRVSAINSVIKGNLKNFLNEQEYGKRVILSALVFTILLLIFVVLAGVMKDQPIVSVLLLIIYLLYIAESLLKNPMVNYSDMIYTFPQYKKVIESVKDDLIKVIVQGKFEKQDKSVLYVSQSVHYQSQVDLTFPFEEELYQNKVKILQVSSIIEVENGDDSIKFKIQQEKDKLENDIKKTGSTKYDIQTLGECEQGYPMQALVLDPQQNTNHFLVKHYKLLYLVSVFLGASLFFRLYMAKQISYYKIIIKKKIYEN